MSRRKKIISPNSNIYNRTPYYQLPNGKILESGDVIKIIGEYGTIFKFIEHVVKLDSGVEWIDCFQINRGIVCGWRSFRPDKIKILSKRKGKNES